MSTHDQPFWGFLRLNMRQGKEEKIMRQALAGWSPHTILHAPEVIETWKELNDPHELGIELHVDDHGNVHTLLSSKNSGRRRSQRRPRKVRVEPWEGGEW